MDKFQYKLLEALCDFAEEDWIALEALLNDKGFTQEEIDRVDRQKYIIEIFEGIEISEEE